LNDGLDYLRCSFPLFGFNVFPAPAGGFFLCEGQRKKERKALGATSSPTRFSLHQGSRDQTTKAFGFERPCLRLRVPGERGFARLFYSEVVFDGLRPKADFPPLFIPCR
jgi:hypothetical protein